MKSEKFETPIVLFIFNRPHFTNLIFDKIKELKPYNLFIIGDGPRPNVESDNALIQETRNIIHQIDWDCNLKINFSDMNLGASRRIVTGLNWVFNFVEYAIILEDDCIPNKSFFRYCHDLLIYYNNDYRIGSISGANFQFNKKRGDHSYFFSNYPLTWGWATWKRVWNLYDENLLSLQYAIKNNLFKRLTANSNKALWWEDRLISIKNKEIEPYWDTIFAFSLFVQNLISIHPNSNLVSNIGSGDLSTNTKESTVYLQIPTVELLFPINHPTIFSIDYEGDQLTSSALSSDKLIDILILRTHKKYRTKFRLFIIKIYKILSFIKKITT